MYCSNCGNNNSDNTHFCDKCGAPIETKISKKNGYSLILAKKVYAVILIAVALVMFCCGIALMKWSMHNKADSKNGEMSVPQMTNNSYTSVYESEKLKQSTENNVLFPIEENGLYGFVNSVGKVIIKPMYDSAYEFQEEFAAVCINGKWGCINKNGDLIIKAIYDHAMWFNEGMAASCLDGSWGYINELGDTVIDFQFEDAASFSEGLAVVNINEKDAIINREGEIIYSIIDVESGEAIINNKGEILYSALDINFGRGWTNGVIRVDAIAERDEYGMGLSTDVYMNRDGEILQPYSEYVPNLVEGLAVVKQDDKYGYINDKGEVIIDFQYDIALDFSEGVAVVEKDDKTFLIDANGNVVFEDDELNLMPYASPNDNGSIANEMKNGLIYAYNSNDRNVCYIINIMGDIILEVDGREFVGLVQAEDDEGVFIVKTVVDYWYEAAGYIDKSQNVVWKSGI